MHGKLKGQFFILGSLLLCVILFAGLPAMVSPGASETGDLSVLSGNLETEVPMAVNLAMIEDGNPGKLADFSDFIRTRTQDRYLGAEMLWLVTTPDPGNPGDIDVYTGNWLGRTSSLDITVDSQEVLQDLDDRETSVQGFSGLGGTFDVSLSFGGRTWSASLPRDKTNLYCFLRLSRGDDAVVKEITG